MPSFLGSDLSHAMREKFISSVRARKRRPDEGGMLIEVLVGMFILVMVFTATSIALANMGDTRVKIEQRDRALAIAANYEELSRVFRCGFIVDRIDDALTKDGGTGDGKDEFETMINNCDFAAKAEHHTPKNGGDQDFEKVETINENSTGASFYSEYSILVGKAWKYCPQRHVPRH